VYWRGAHGDHLEEIVRESTRLVGGAAVSES